MSKEEFAQAFLEGANVTKMPPVELNGVLAGMIYDLRKQIKRQADRMSIMNDVAAESQFHVKCRGCGEWYDMPCDLIEFDPEYSYCNSGHGGAYHCAP